MTFGFVIAVNNVARQALRSASIAPIQALLACIAIALLRERRDFDWAAVASSPS